MAFLTAILFPGGEPHLERQIAQNQTVHRDRSLNLARLKTYLFRSPLSPAFDLSNRVLALASVLLQQP